METRVCRSAQTARGDPGEGLPADLHGARSRCEQPVEHADERGLAGAGEAHDDEDLAALDLEAGVDDGGGRVGVQVGARAAIAQVSEGFGAAAPEDLVQTFGLQSDLVSHGLLCLAAMSVRSWISGPSVERRGAIQGARAVQESRRWLPLSNA